MGSSRTAREAEFHDRAFTSNVRERAGKFYVVARSSKDYYHRLVERDCAGKRVLEYGCGTGSHAFILAKRGAKVWGIDISEAGTKLAAEKASKLGIAEQTSFQVMDAEALKFPENSFDIVCGSGILHHLDLEKSMKEIYRVLKSGGGGDIFRASRTQSLDQSISKADARHEITGRKTPDSRRPRTDRGQLRPHGGSLLPFVVTRKRCHQIYPGLSIDQEISRGHGSNTLSSTMVPKASLDRGNQLVEVVAESARSFRPFRPNGRSNAVEAERRDAPLRWPWHRLQFRHFMPPEFSLFSSANLVTGSTPPT